MGDKREINVQLTLNEFVSAQYLHQRRVRLFATAAVLIAMLFFAGPPPWHFKAVLTAGFGLFIGLAAFLLVNSRFGIFAWRMRRLFRQQKSLHRPFIFSWDEQGTGANGEGFTSQTPWTDYLRWRESKELFLLYFSDVMFRLIPKRAFPNSEEIDEFRDLLRQKISPVEGRKRAND